MDLEVVRADLQRVGEHRATPVALADGQIRVRVDAFALSANNISYAVFGDMMSYWDFFPAGTVSDDNAVWGRIPVWGFGQVVESLSPDVIVGERLFGYFPMGDELVITCGRADARGITDVSPHRSALASAYNRYQRCATDSAYRAEREAHQMLLYPLFFTSFVVDDFLLDNDDFGAEQIVISSASAKTAIGAAYLAHRRGQRVVGLTSAGNTDFVTSLGVYDEVITYTDVASIAPVPSVYVDVAGDQVVRHAVHARLGDLLGHSMTVGGTHWDSPADTDAATLAGPRPTFFFAPSQISKRSKEWGRDGLDARVSEAWHLFAAWVDGWIDFRHADTPEAVITLYRELLSGRVDPRLGHLCSLITT